MVKLLVNNMITGVDYVVYSTTSIFQIVDLFYKNLKTIWEQFIVEEFDYKADEYLELFFAKDEEMNHYHEKKGFNLDSKGEGCFMIFGKKLAITDLNIFVSEQIHYQKDIVTQAYNSKLLAKNLWEFTLVLPDTVEGSLFCKFIMDSLLNSLKDSME